MKYLKYYETIKNDKYHVYVNFDAEFIEFNDLKSAIEYSENLLNKQFLIKLTIYKGSYTVRQSEDLVKWYGVKSYWSQEAKKDPTLVLKYLTGVKGYYETILKLEYPRRYLNKIKNDYPKLWNLLKQYVDPNEMEDFANLNDLGI